MFKEDLGLQLVRTCPLIKDPFTLFGEGASIALGLWISEKKSQVQVKQVNCVLSTQALFCVPPPPPAFTLFTWEKTPSKTSFITFDDFLWVGEYLHILSQGPYLHFLGSVWARAWEHLWDHGQDCWSSGFHRVALSGQQLGQSSQSFREVHGNQPHFGLKLCTSFWALWAWYLTGCICPFVQVWVGPASVCFTHWLS